MMRTRAIGAALGVTLLLAACAGAPLPPPPGCGQNAAGCAGNPTPASTPAAPAGTASGTVTYKWTQNVSTSDVGFQSTTSQTYEASVDVTSTSGESGGWELAGTATVQASFKNDVATQNTSSLGPCNTHYTDDVPKFTKGDVPVTGGLEARDGFFQFHVEVAPVAGATNTSVRDDSGCFGTNTTETNPWDIGSQTLGGSGSFGGSSFSGSENQPNPDGITLTTWSFQIN